MKSSLLRQWAKSLDADIEAKTRPLSGSPTRKRVEEFRTRFNAGRRLERLKNRLLVLADHYDAITVPASLIALKNKQAFIWLNESDDLPEANNSLAKVFSHFDQNEYRSARAEFLAMGDQAAGELNQEDRLMFARLEVALKRIASYFPTPKPIVERLIEAAHIQPGETLLEPSAGSGHIADMLRERFPDHDLKVIEQHPDLREILTLANHNLVGSDFLTYGDQVDVVMQNPPFEKYADIAHLKHAFSLAQRVVVSVMSNAPFFRSDSEAEEFRAWFKANGGEKIDCPPDAFKDSDAPTGTKVVLVRLNKGTPLPPLEPFPEPEIVEQRRDDLPTLMKDLAALRKQAILADINMQIAMMNISMAEKADYDDLVPFSMCRTFSEGQYLKDGAGYLKNEIGRVTSPQTDWAITVQLVGEDGKPKFRTDGSPVLHYFAAYCAEVVSAPLPTIRAIVPASPAPVTPIETTFRYVRKITTDPVRQLDQLPLF